jgi:N utilization substance protein A
MNRQEILDTVESVHREWQVERQVVFSGLEEAFTAAIRKHLRIEGEIQVEIDRATGEIHASRAGVAIDLGQLGRVGYQFAKQRFLQLLKEARDHGVQTEFMAKRRGLVNAQVIRTEGGVVLLRVEPRYEGILPPREQIPGEAYLPGSLILALAKEVERKGAEARFVLSRACDEFIVKLLEREVPEVQSGSCKVRGVARDPGYRTKIFVESTRENVDCVGACVGVGRSRVRSLVSELGGEHIDLIPWSDDEVDRVRQAMKPAEILEVHPDRRRRRATVYVRPGELSQAIGKGGRNVRLAVRLTGWEIDVFEHPGEPPAEQLAGQSAGGEGTLS